MKNKRNILNFSLFIVFFIILLFMIGHGRISSGSMEPALNTGNRVIINKLSYVASEPQRGDIVAFKKDGEVLIKRVIGVGGDTIESLDGTLIINGYVLKEPYIDDNIETNFIGTLEVPDGYYFVLGDNREQSIDARYWEEPFISKEQIIGRVVYCFDGFPGHSVGRYAGTIGEVVK